MVGLGQSDFGFERLRESRLKTCETLSCESLN